MENTTIKINRKFSMANKETFKCPPIKSFVEKYLIDSKISIDPFARDYQHCTYTNDLNPKTKAQYHMKAESFLQMLVEQEVKADLVIFDPPYSMEQCKRAYESYGYKFTHEDSLYVIRWTKEKDLVDSKREAEKKWKELENKFGKFSDEDTDDPMMYLRGWGSKPRKPDPKRKIIYGPGKKISVVEVDG